MQPDKIDRRAFLARGGCAAHLALAASLAPPGWTRRWLLPSVGTVVVREPFATLERLAEGVWAVVSDPLSGDRTTLCNGGLIAGRNAVVAIEGFFQPAGAAWLAGKSRELLGRWPTHVVLTHFHADHANGLGGYSSQGTMPPTRTTATTRNTALERNTGIDPSTAQALKDVVVLAAETPSSLDLGGRIAHLVPRLGHTASDISIELDDPSLVFCGDLLWNGLFPNYVDAIPSRLSVSVRAMRRTAKTIYVPGHGAVADGAAYDRYVQAIDAVEEAARRAHAQGISAAEGGAAFTLPASLGEWVLFGRTYFERAFTAWYRELDGA